MSGAEIADATRDAVSAMELLGEGATARDVIDLLGSEKAIEGMRHYANYLEAVLVATHRMAVPDIRAAALDSAAKMAHRA